VVEINGFPFFYVWSIVKTFQSEQEKPLVILVHEQSILRTWMEKALSRWFRVCIFSTVEDATAFVRSTKSLDVLITDLDLSLSVLGGCNIAREVHQVFPQCHIFIFRSSNEDDHRMMILNGMNRVKFLTKPFGSLFLVSHVKTALNEQKDD
jgi:DNA-binding NtrC family response regulator